MFLDYNLIRIPSQPEEYLQKKNIPEKGRLVRVEEVERDPVTKKVHWVRIQYFKNGELLHDVQFVPTIKKENEWLMIGERIFGDFIPKNRYRPMLRKAIAITYSNRKQVKPATQPNLPLK